MAKSSLLVILTVFITASQTTAQTPSGGGGGGGVPSCAMKLAPCFSYLNGTTAPPKECCDPIKETVTKERACLCSIYNNPSLIQAFHINVTQALNLISLCHVDSVKDVNTVCKAEAPSPSTTSTGSTPGSPGLAKSPSSSTPSGSSPGNAAGNAAGRNTGTGLALAAVLFLFGVYSILY